MTESMIHPILYEPTWCSLSKEDAEWMVEASKKIIPEGWSPAPLINSYVLELEIGKKIDRSYAQEMNERFCIEYPEHLLKPDNE